LRHRPDFAEANLLLGLISERNGDLRAAEDYIRRAVYFDPQHYEAVCHLAILAEKRGNVAGAEAARQRAARVLQRQEGRKDKAQ
jgi:chemotaxis protein methyltransferase WspC